MKTLFSIPVMVVFALIAVACNTTKPQSHRQTSADVHGKRWIFARFTDTVVGRPEKPIYLMFEKDSTRLTGFSGCNGLRATYKLSGQSLEIGPITSTRMWCNHAATEQYFLKVLERTNALVTSEDSLFLMLEDYTLASFYAESAPKE